GFTNYNVGRGEHMGFQTQKPLGLLEQIIRASSNPGDVVFDPFCGCATTLHAAHNLSRQWIGIDIAIHAVKRVARMRLRDQLGLVEGKDFEIEGVPRNIEGARDLWERDKYHFQKWAVEEAEGFVTTRRTADGGIDGRLYFAVPDDPMLQSMVIEVKGGNPTIADVRSLRGVLEREDALMAGLIIMDELGDRKDRNFRKEMASAGHVELWGNEYPAMQILTVSDLLDGKRFQTPTVMGKHTPEPRMPGLPR
ncbi:MAG: site-specific DNA-methyltransferase, partial [Chloroflexi bacterium]|nr:site-specific DNA-methyltransferase [Chloroflexota bacterium]